MELEKFLTFEVKDKNLLFRTITESDVTEDYVKGLKEQKKFIENIPNDISFFNQKKYIKEITSSESDTICGLFLDNILIGTAGIQLSLSKIFMKNIDYEVSDIATIGIIIFNRNYRGIGLGKILVWASTYLFYSCEDIEWFGAGMEKENIPSYKSFRACGYKKIKSDQKENYVVLNKLDLKKPEFINDVILQNY